MCEIIPPGERVLDIGAGAGRYVRAFRESGRPAFGIDGNGLENEDVTFFDLVCQRDPAEMLFGHPFFAPDFTLPKYAICIEVGEHIPPGLTTAFFLSLVDLYSSKLILSWATPGQRGRGHVTCLLPEEVAVKLNRFSQVLNQEDTVRARQTAGGDWQHKLLVFDNCQFFGESLLQEHT